MTVDNYWDEGDRVHLMRGGVDLSVPRSRVRSMKEVSGPAEAGVRPDPVPAPSTAPAPVADESREDLERSKVRIERHVVRVNQKISIAQSRGDSPREVKRLERELAR
ncbi:MAG TPA: hypothetical protein VKA21_01275, partial [Candidatus Binatia bacterium]|nr:hypothetical protein [Candidatus Binatia bacterium]